MSTADLSTRVAEALAQIAWVGRNTEHDLTGLGEVVSDTWAEVRRLQAEVEAVREALSVFDFPAGQEPVTLVQALRQERDAARADADAARRDLAQLDGEGR